MCEVEYSSLDVDYQGKYHTRRERRPAGRTYKTKAQVDYSVQFCKTYQHVNAKMLEELKRNSLSVNKLDFGEVTGMPHMH